MADIFFFLKEQKKSSYYIKIINGIHFSAPVSSDTGKFEEPLKVYKNLNTYITAVTLSKEILEKAAKMIKYTRV